MITVVLILAVWIVLAAVVAPLAGKGIHKGQHGDLVAERTAQAEARRRHPSGRVPA